MEIVKLLLARADIDLAPRKSPSSTPLYLAARNGHEDLVDVLLHTPGSEAMLGHDQGSYGGSPLHAAAEHGHRGAVKLLLAHNGTDPGSQDTDDATPLHLAAGNGNKDVVNELLTASNIEAIVDFRDNNGETPLHRAAIHGHDDCVIALMDCADVNVQDQDLCTPLFRAVQEEHHKVVGCLLKKPGILVHVPDKDQFTPLHIALRMGNESIVRQLLNGSGFGKTPKDTHRALLSCATQTGNILMLKLLLERLEPNVIAANINALDENEQTLLWSAAKRRDNGVMELLITKDVVTLRLLVQKGEAILVRVLLEAGYNVDTRDNLGRSALHIATILGHFDVAKNLVSFGASVDCKDERGNTALRLAIKRKRCNIIDMLLESSADTTGVTTDEWLDSYDRKIPDAVHLEEEPSGKKIIRFIEAAVIPDTIRQMHNAPKTKSRLT
jgi:ankyrin repeat protein